MKKTLALLLAALLTLSACGGPEPIEQEKRTVDTARSFVHYYQDACYAETEDNIYFALDFGWPYLLCVDKATGICGPVCGKPECGHDDETCNAYLGWTVRCVGIYRDRLYWVATEYNGGYHEFIGSAALDGSDHRREREIEDGLFPDHTGNQTMMMYEGAFYFATIKYEIRDGVEKEYNYVCRIPLDPQEETEVILEEETPGSNNLPIQPYNGKLYIISDNHVGDDETGCTYDFKLRRWDIESGEMETLYAADGSSFYHTTEPWVTEDGVLFNSHEIVDSETSRTKIYKYEFETGEVRYLFYNDLVENTVRLEIADGIVAGYFLYPSEEEEGVYDLPVRLWDFDGNVLVDETYTFDLGRGFWINYTSLCGRDETNAYIALFAEGSDQDTSTYYATLKIIAVALDGSGAKVLCTGSLGRDSSGRQFVVQ